MDETSNNQQVTTSAEQVKSSISQKKNGRPFIYNADFHPAELLRLMETGYKDCEIYSEWNISKDCFYRWMREYPSFKEAHEQGMPKAEKAWEEIGKAGMMGQIRGFNAAVWFGFMKKKFPDWKEANSNTVNVNNTTQTVNFFTGKTDQELLDFIKSSTKQLQAQGMALDAEYTEVLPSE